MSRPIRSAGMAPAGDHLVLGVGGERVGGDDVDGQDDLDAPLLRPARGSRLTDVELVGLEQALADLVALGREEGEDHAAADEQAVGGPEQVVDDPELVGDLRAAEHHGIRALGVLGQAAQHADLGLDEATDGRAAAGGRRRRRWPACGARRRSRRRRRRRRARRAAPANSARSSSVLAVSPALKRRFSSSTTSPSWAASTAAPRALAHGVGGEGDVAAEHLAEACRDRAPASTRSSGAPLGRPRWAHTMTRAPASDRAWIVGTDARMRPSSVIVRAVERHVEVRPDEDALAAQVAQLGDRHCHAAVRGSGRRAATRSTRRLE